MHVGSLLTARMRVFVVAIVGVTATNWHSKCKRRHERENCNDTLDKVHGGFVDGPWVQRGHEGVSIVKVNSVS
jgi:hypothetical protein